MLRLSELFVRTLRADPSDADVPSHRLLIRAGYIRRVAPGIYSWLPLGLAVLRNVEAVVREEMARIGGQEVVLPTLIPREVFDRSGRWTEYGNALFHLQDRKGAEYLLGPTHEEQFALLVKGECSSYRDLPLTLFQIQAKYRDEARPRAGVLRGREFIMKDSYSFDLDDDGLARSYQAHRDAYEAMFRRLGLEYRIVAAVSGAMGGSASEEFLAPLPSGEDTFAQCRRCRYAANIEAVQLAGPDAARPDGPPPSRLLEPRETPTVPALVAWLNELGLGRRFRAADILKNLVVKTRQPGSDRWEPLVIGVPGDREVDLRRVGGQLEPLEVEPVGGDDLAAWPSLVRGYIGPQALASQGIRYLVDPLVAEGSAWVTGANAPERHAIDVVRGRDFVPDGEIGAVEVRDGDPCGRCGGPLVLGRGIELGHVFQLGRKYADVLGLDVAGPDGRPIRVTMGSYGIGITRAVAALAEQTLDERGLCWPPGVGPADVHVMVTAKGEEAVGVADALVADLDRHGVRVLYDDRAGLSAGVRFADAELLGVPTIVVVGRSLVSGSLEVRDRRRGTRREVPLADAIEELGPPGRAALVGG